MIKSTVCVKIKSLSKVDKVDIPHRDIFQKPWLNFDRRQQREYIIFAWFLVSQDCCKNYGQPGFITGV